MSLEIEVDFCAFSYPLASRTAGRNHGRRRDPAERRPAADPAILAGIRRTPATLC